MMVNHLNVLTSNHLYYFFRLQMSTSCNAIEDLLKIQDKLQKNLNTLLAATIEACLRMEVPQSQQSDNSLEQLSHDGITQSLKRDVIVCNKCHLNGHLAASCRSSWTKEGKYIGEGEPPADLRDIMDHYWTTRHAAKYIEHIKQQKKRTTAAAAEQQPQPSTSVRDAVCSKCHHKGHFARDCTAIFSTTGKFLGTGAPPPNHYWTKRNAKEAFKEKLLKLKKRKKTVQA